MASKRQVAGQKIDTLATVRQAMAMSETKVLDLDGSSDALNRLGHANPAEALVMRYAREMRLLSTLDEMVPGMNCLGQIGKWNMMSEETIHVAFNSYLNRRIAGQHQRWSGRK